MKKKIILVVCLSAITAFTASLTFADNRPGAVTLTVGEAYYHYALKRHLENTGTPNVSLAYNFDDRWAIEGMIGVHNTNQTAYLGSHGVHGFLYTVDGLYRFTPKGRWAPYVSAGIGSLGLKPQNNDSVHQGNINAGVGTQYFIDDSIALRCEVKDLYTMSGGKNDFMLNLGVSFLMGGSQAAVVSSAYKS